MAYYFSYNTKGLYGVIQENTRADILARLYLESKLHCTMLYSNEEYQKAYSKLKVPATETTVTGLTVWETFPGFVLVARLEDSQLQVSHNLIKDTFGITHGHEFNPHITLQRTDNKDDLVPMENLEFLIGQKVELNGFRCIPIRK